MDLPTNYDALTQPQRAQARRQYAKEQGGKCAHCKCSLYGDPSQEVMAYPLDEMSFPYRFFAYPIHLHHNHMSGMTIGAVHARCNGVLQRLHGE